MLLWLLLAAEVLFTSGVDNSLTLAINNVLPTKLFDIKDYKGKHMQIMESIRAGTQIGLEHCQKQFQWERWNCPASEYSREGWNQATKEAAFSAAIMAAGVAYSITRNCTLGLIPGCSCSSKLYKSPKSGKKESWIWEGCSDDTAFSSQLTKMFLGSVYKNSKDDISQASLHNHQIGVAAVQNTLKVSCKCHGISGSCTVKSCWKHVAPFQEIASLLKKKYRKAVRMGTNSVQRIPWKKVPKGRMVYITDSPDYCKVNNTTGWMGTVGRTCSEVKVGDILRTEESSCHRLCITCGHRVRQKKRLHKWQCNCQFHWCCNVTCQTCSQIVQEQYCEAASSND